jgi:inorganic phosphate transporter, PiT family
MLPLLLTILLALYVACNLGANDVANSMGTSVGSKAITLRQALAIAAIFEFTGAVLFGRRVSQTLITGVIDPALFADTPQVLLLGMIATLLACGIWLQLATALGLPVASSHAIVGAIAPKHHPFPNGSNSRSSLAGYDSAHGWLSSRVVPADAAHS